MDSDIFWSDKLLFLPMNLDNSLVSGIMIIRLHLAICGLVPHYSKVWVRVNLIRYKARPEPIGG